VRLAGIDGNDQLIGGIAEVLPSGGPGNDRIDARYRAADTVDCGGQAFDWAAVDIDGETAVTGCAEVTSAASTNDYEEDDR
jgi:hypothetical protein